LILLLIFVVRTSASDCLEDRRRNDLQCVERDVKPHSLTHISYKEVMKRVTFDAVKVLKFNTRVCTSLGNSGSILNAP